MKSVLDAQHCKNIGAQRDFQKARQSVRVSSSHFLGGTSERATEGGVRSNVRPCILNQPPTFVEFELINLIPISMCTTGHA